MADESEKRPIIIIKKKGGHGGHHGGAWKVAYADFVTAMMALFIVLWLLSTSQKTRDAISGYFKDPLGNGKLKEPGSNIKGTGKEIGAEAKAKPKDDMKELKEKIKAALKMIPHFDKLKANVELTITEEGLKIELLENSKGMFFDSGKPVPSPVGQQVLIAVAKEIGKIPNRLLIEGHTDATPYGSDTYSNWDLSSNRANETRKIMNANGLGKNQVAQIRGYADQDLRDKKDPKDPANRRVSLIVRYLDQAPELKLKGLAEAADPNALPTPLAAASNSVKPAVEHAGTEHAGAEHGTAPKPSHK